MTWPVSTGMAWPTAEPAHGNAFAVLIGQFLHNHGQGRSA